jgi:hypothetical protein
MSFRIGSTVLREGVYGTIIGGPTTLSYRNFGQQTKRVARLWTVLTDTAKTKVWCEADMHQCADNAFLDLARHCYKVKLSNVITAECPSCEEDDMIFYEGDYLCAWCREMLES